MILHDRIKELRRESGELIDEGKRIQAERDKREDKKLTEAEGTRLTEINTRLDAIRHELPPLLSEANFDQHGEHFQQQRQRPIEGDLNQDDEPSQQLDNGGFRDCSEFMRAVYERSAYHRPNEKLDALVQHERETRAGTGQAEDSDAVGGYLVPSSFASTILQNTFDAGQVASRCFQVPISNGRSTSWAAVDETSRVAGSRYGGVTTYWEGEADSITASTAKFRRVNLNLHKLVAAVYATGEVLEDAPQMQGFIETAVPNEISTVVDDAIINGTGAGKPLGVLQSGCLISIAAESSGNGAGTLVFLNVSKALARQLNSGRSVWFRSRSTGPQLQTMTVGDYPVWLANTSAVGSPVQSGILGRPDFVIEQCAAVGTVGDIISFDGGSYLLGRKGGVNMATSIHVRFLQDEQIFRFIVRLDGRPWMYTTLTEMYGSGTISPFVAVATRT